VSGRLVAASALALLLTLCVGIFDHEIWSPTEPAVAGVVWNMVDRGHWAAPMIGDAFYLEKPPLYYWLGALACAAAGRLDAGLLRLPAALAGLGALALVGWIVRRRHGDDAAAVAVLLGATAIPILELAHRATPDVLALFFAFLGFALYARGSRWDWALAAALAASFYAKNFFVLFVVAPPIAVDLLLQREWRRGLRLGLAMLGFSALFIAPWALALHDAGGAQALRVVFVDNTVGRLVDVAAEARPALGPLNDAWTAERDGPLWTYLLNLPAIAAPWTLAAVAALPLLFRSEGRDAHRRFLGIALVTVPVVLTLASSRNSAYLRPLAWVPLLAVAELLVSPLRRWQRVLLDVNLWLVLAAVAGVAVALAVRFAGPASLGWAALCIAGALAVARWQRTPFGVAAFAAAGLAGSLFLAVPHVDAQRSTAAFFAAARDEVEGRAVYATRIDDRRYPLLTWYLRRPVPVLESRAEAIARLAGGEPAGIFVPGGPYRRGEWDDVPHRALEAPSGKRPFVLLLN
jgi:4-amino-4-deoxy-L-arabinose transferase-like glycosyltransferase